MSAKVGARARELLSGVRVAPSILSADFGRLREQVGEVLDAGARVIHVDVMDGHFVPPITVGPLVVEGARRAGRARPAAMLDVHLMIERPERHVARVRQGGRGLDHVPRRGDAACRLRGEPDPRERRVRRRGDQPGDARRGARGGRRRDRHGAVHDRQPGLGRAGVHRALAREAAARARARRRCSSPCEVDGGIDAGHRAALPAAPARTCSSPGSAIFGAPSPGEAYRAIADAVQAVELTAAGRRGGGARLGRGASSGDCRCGRARQREREQRRRAGVADLGAQQLVGDRGQQHPARRTARRRAASSTAAARARSRASAAWLSAPEVRCRPMPMPISASPKPL